MDWNDDGLDDILVGEYGGRIKFYMSVTPDSLTEMDDIQAGGSYIEAGLIGTPRVVDWNGDGYNDLLVGFSSPGTSSSIQLYTNTGSSGTPVLEEGIDVLFGGEPLITYGCTPWTGDVDQDGLFDLVYGDIQGNFYISLNNGSAGAPAFPAPEQLNAGTAPMNLQLNGAPCIADWNEDGFQDIVAGCGEDGYIWAFLSPYTTGISSGTSGTGLTVDLLTNPAAGSLAISASSSQPGSIQFSVYDLSGRIVLSRALQLNDQFAQFSFDMDGYNPGIYLYSAKSGESAVTGAFTLAGAGK